MKQRVSDPITPHRPQERRRAFTLVELIVTIGVIAFLTGLTVSATVALVQRAEVHKTEDIIRLLDLAQREWELTADRKLSWGDDPNRHDIWSDREFTLIITELLGVIQRNQRVKDMIAKIDPDLIFIYEEGEMPAWIPPGAEDQYEQFIGGMTILDAWGVPIYATHPGAPAGPGTPIVDPDGTEQTRNEQYYGIARDRRVCFISAGPDQRFGLYSEFTGMYGEELQEALKEARKDNIYSYPTEVPEFLP
ncbi:MAG: type II secretion system protein [Planctomycetota bacterium]|nr:type II secretion system protein [Planctomycetota bacterium]